MPHPEEDVLTDRLSLLWLAPDDLATLVDGDTRSVESAAGAPLPADWLAENGGLVHVRAKQIERDPASAPWLLRLIIRLEPAAVVGLINFHGPPDPRGFAEVGYSLEPEHRGQGYAIEAVRGLFDWAHRNHGVQRFRASISPANDRSQNLVRKLGMVEVGSQWDDDDGLEVIWTVEGWPDSKG